MNDDERYRIFAVKPGRREPRELASATDAAGLGTALLTLHADQRANGRRLSDLGTIGILDDVAHEWIVLPWRRGDTRGAT